MAKDQIKDTFAALTFNIINNIDSINSIRQLGHEIGVALADHEDDMELIEFLEGVQQGYKALNPNKPDLVLYVKRDK